LPKDIQTVDDRILDDKTLHNKTLDNNNLDDKNLHDGNKKLCLAGQVAIVTGGAKGIGLAIAEDLAKRGAAVLVADLAGAAAAAERLRAAGHRAVGLAVDVACEADTAALAKVASAEFGGIDILINNAGLYSTLKPRPFEDIDPAEWRRVMEVNTLGIFLCCRAVLPALKSRGGGRIINISSGVAFKGNPWMAHYVASKGAVVSLTRALASELGRYNILVNSVAPGFTLSDGVLENPELVAGVRQPSMRTRVLAREMTPADLVGAVAFFAGTDAAFLTGQTIVVDGGAYFH
jgi:NAD(P)-dependent dehydrogenase (short-subunit alcohol dehydrogenase family)